MIELIRKRAVTEEFDYQFLMDCLAGYKNPRDKITRLMRSGVIVRVKKGRDWYDLVWYIGREVKVSLSHLEQRMRQTRHLKGGPSLNKERLIEMLDEKIDGLDISSAKKDVLPMLKDVSSVDVWSKEFFKDIFQRIKYQ